MSILNSMREVYSNKPLLYSMVIRDFKGRYKNSFFGFLWHFITPVVLIIMFYIVFTNIRMNPIENYWIYLCVGMFPFTFFQGNILGGTFCITSNGGLIKKMYFPREIVVFSQVISLFITLLITYVGMVVILMILGFSLSLSALLFLPILMLLSIVFALGYVFFLSAVSVFVRDIQHIMTVVGRIIFWTTPIFYLTSEVTGILSKIIWCNPLTYFIESYHDILYFGVVPDTMNMIVCCLLALVAFTGGLMVFNRLKGRFAEKL